MPLVFLLDTYINHFSPPFQRQFVINDISINHPFAEHERVPNEWNIVYSLFVPIVIISTLTILLAHPKHKLYVGYISILGLLVSFFVNGLITDILKNWIGRHRPDFIARCIPSPDAPLDTLVFAKDVCTTTNIARLEDGFRTTPSGHSSTAFSGLGYLSLWLSGQLLSEHPLSGSWRKLLSFVPIICASLIALSRTEDYRHHFVDVILGSTLGFTVAYTTYRKNFPKLTSPVAFKPILDDSGVKADVVDILKADNSDPEVESEGHLLSSRSDAAEV